MNLQELKDTLRKAASPDCEQLPAGHCLECKKEAWTQEKGYNPTLFYSQAGMREFHISGLCEVCFDGLCDE